MKFFSRRFFVLFIVATGCMYTAYSRDPTVNPVGSDYADPCGTFHGDPSACDDPIEYDTFYAVMGAIQSGATTVINHRRSKVIREVEQLQASATEQQITFPTSGFCLKKGFEISSTSTTVAPATSPALFLGDPWDCY